jgi:phosphocarrier protein
MTRTHITIVNKLGLHARAAAKFVQMASLFDSEVKVLKGDREVNGKSIMGVMMLAAGQGSELELLVDGTDEQEATTMLTELVAGRFGEGE